MNLHIKTGLGIKSYVLDPNFDVENNKIWTDFWRQIRAKNTIFFLISNNFWQKTYIHNLYDLDKRTHINNLYDLGNEHTSTTFAI